MGAPGPRDLVGSGTDTLQEISAKLAATEAHNRSEAIDRMGIQVPFGDKNECCGNLCGRALNSRSRQPPWPAFEAGPKACSFGGNDRREG